MEHLIHNIGYFLEIKNATPAIMKSSIHKNKTLEKLYATQKEKEGKTHLHKRKYPQNYLPFSYLYRPIRNADKTTYILLFLFEVNKIIQRKYLLYLYFTFANGKQSLSASLSFTSKS